MLQSLSRRHRLERVSPAANLPLPKDLVSRQRLTLLRCIAAQLLIVLVSLGPLLHPAQAILIRGIERPRPIPVVLPLLLPGHAPVLLIQPHDPVSLAEQLLDAGLVELQDPLPDLGVEQVDFGSQPLTRPEVALLAQDGHVVVACCVAQGVTVPGEVVVAAHGDGDYLWALLGLPPLGAAAC